MVVGGVLAIRLQTCEKIETYRFPEHNVCRLTFRSLRVPSFRPLLQLFVTPVIPSPHPFKRGQRRHLRRMIGFNPAQGGVASMPRMAALRDYRNCQKRQVAPILKSPLTRARKLKLVSAFVICSRQCLCETPVTRGSSQWEG
jgi:hypothetical protein